MRSYKEIPPPTIGPAAMTTHPKPGSVTTTSSAKPTHQRVRVERGSDKNGPFARSFIAADLVAQHGETARQLVCGPMLEAVELELERVAEGGKWFPASSEGSSNE